MKTMKLTLFVTGQSIRSQQAMINLNAICKESLNGDAEVEIIDVLENPEEAEKMQILATPALIKEEPLPACRIIGDLSNRDKVLNALQKY
ncbi:MAG: circadian clock KaiB family protein [Candidatus Sumerlaeia bacterium]